EGPGFVSATEGVSAVRGGPGAARMHALRIERRPARGDQKRAPLRVIELARAAQDLLATEGIQASPPSNGFLGETAIVSCFFTVTVPRGAPRTRRTYFRRVTITSMRDSLLARLKKAASSAASRSVGAGRRVSPRGLRTTTWAPD